MLSVGIHITENSVYFSGVSIGESKPKVQFLEEHFFKDQKEEKAVFIANLIEKIQKNNKGEALRFCYGLSQNVVTSFFVRLPFKEKFKIIRTLPFEIEDQTPFQLDKVFFDARICKIKNQKESASICFVTPEENVQEFVHFSGKFCKKPYLLSCETSALANILEYWNKPLSQSQNPTSHQFYLYLGANNSQFLFYKDGHLEYVSVLDWSVGAAVKDMEKFYKLKAEKAWEEFFEKSFILTSAKGFSKEQVFFSNLIKKRVQELMNQLQLLKVSFETGQKIKMEDVILLGPGSVIKNLTAFLTAETSMTFSKLKTLEVFPYLDLQEKSSALMALGLSLEGLKRAPYEGINFLKSTDKEPPSLFPKIWQKRAVIVFIAFFVFAAYTFVRKRESYRTFERIQPVFMSFGKQIAFMNEDEIHTEKIKSFLKKEKNKTQDEQFIKEKLALANPMDKIQLITQQLGGAEKWNLNITYLKVEENNIQMKGSLNKSSLENFRSQLKTLVKGPIKELPKEKEIKLEDSPKQAEAAVSPAVKKGANQKDKKRDSKQGMQEPLTQEQSDSESPDQKDMAFFSYTFELKEVL